MPNLKEFLVAYKCDGADELESLGIEGSESNWMPGVIDLDRVESFFHARQNDKSAYTETTVTLHSGDSSTIKMHYNDFKKLIL